MNNDARVHVGGMKATGHFRPPMHPEREEMTMMRLRVRNVVLAAAATLLATLALPAQAGSTPSQTEMSLVSVPACRGTETPRLRRPCRKVATYAPMLFIGVGW
jgi:hypothetical protein